MVSISIRKGLNLHVKLFRNTIYLVKNREYHVELVE